MVRSNQPTQPEVDLSATQYAQRARRLMGIVSNLRALGAQTVVDLPRIAVIGCQSAGKSSLVEAVSGVRVPRDSGTCTRCPMECSMYSTDQPWSCRISLRFEYDENDRPLAEIRRVTFGPELSDKSEVELLLRQAQAAVLNPHMSPGLFLEKTVDELQHYRTEDAFENGTLKFSRNAVVVDIFDPDSANLSFTDLPGLIQNEEDGTVKLVEGLVKSNIRGNCLILVAIPMSDDMENQRAKRLAQEADPEHVRTIGVLTKPDTITAGATSARQKWVDVIRGRTHKLKYGYFCVRLADDDERSANLSRADMQSTATEFFLSTAPWDQFVDRSRFGIPNLVTDLSHRLTTIIDETLPKLRLEVQGKIDECKENLSLLPASVRPDASDILSMISEFCTELVAMIYGSGHTPKSKAFVQANREAYATFKRSIRATVPDFKPFENGSAYFSIEEHGEMGDIRVHSLDLRDVQNVIKRSIAWELPHNVPFDAKSKLIKDFVDLWDEPVSSCYDAITRRLDACLQAKVHTYFAQFPFLRAKIWSLTSEQFENAKIMTYTDVFKALKLEKGPFFTQNSHYLDSVRDKWLCIYKDARRDPEDLLIPPRSFNPPLPSDNSGCMSPQPAPEMPPPISNGHSVRKGKVGKGKKGKIVQPSASPTWNEYDGPQPAYSPAQSPEERALQALADLGYTGLSVEDLARLNPPDEYEEALLVMADVRAYFQVAYKRIIDSIPLTIEHSLNQYLADTIQKTLVKQLDFGSSDSNRRLAELLAEDPDIVAKRDELKAKLRRLEQVQQELRGFGL